MCPAMDWRPVQCVPLPFTQDDGWMHKNLNVIHWYEVHLKRQNIIFHLQAVHNPHLPGRSPPYLHTNLYPQIFLINPPHCPLCSPHYQWGVEHLPPNYGSHSPLAVTTLIQLSPLNRHILNMFLWVCVDCTIKA